MAARAPRVVVGRLNGCYATRVPRRARMGPRGRTAYREEADSGLSDKRSPARRSAREPRLVSAGRTGTGRRPIDSTGIHLRFAVIGAGRLGASLGIALRHAGARLVGYTAASAAGRARAVAWLGGAPTEGISTLVDTQPDLYVIAVPDQVLPEVSVELGNALRLRGGASSGRAEAGRPADRPFVAHTSGATSVTVLEACARAGASTLVFHPLQTFSDPSSGAGRFAGAAVAVTPDEPAADSQALALGFALARALGSRPFFLPDDKRALYHAAATVACNYLVTLEHHAERLFIEAGLPATEALSLFLPLVRATLDNISGQGTVASLTGPLSRGDTGTVIRHLEALATAAPQVAPLYQALGLATLDVVRARNEVRQAVVAELERLLSPPGAAPRAPVLLDEQGRES